MEYFENSDFLKILARFLDFYFLFMCMGWPTNLLIFNFEQFISI